MKAKTAPENQPHRAGMALVLVLGALVLLSILVVAFLASIRTERTSTFSYASSADVKQRAQTAVNMVIAQIQEASSSSTIAWTSQPGLIRTFDNAGSPVKAYKLYSSASMIAGGTFDAATAAQTEIPADWKSRPAEFTDINEPVLVRDTSGPLVKDQIAYTPNYPVLDPGALGTVKGFSIDGKTVPPDYTTEDPTAQNPAPMPVQWLYLLKDGSIRAMDSTQKVSDASKDNPIVSRIAFWTDDETCKVNINTAAGDEWSPSSPDTTPGSFADLPMASQSFEGLLKNNQPVVHEFQRYPGHPATTYLSAVFPDLLKRSPSLPTEIAISDIAPKISADSTYSDGGTRSTIGINPNTYPGLPFTDGLPLYSSIDELRYKRSLTARTDSLFPPARIEQAKFFLTANSRAPEVNLFNKPRISMWPEPAKEADRTAFDKTIAFCSTVAGQPFYFVRSDPASSTADYDDQPRNQKLIAYLRDLTSQAIPGFGGNFLQKYPAAAGGPTERDQILTELFDYIRSCVNLVDTTSATPYAGTKSSGASRSNPPGTGNVIPIQIPGLSAGTTMGFGRTQTVYSPILLFTALKTDVYNTDTKLPVASVNWGTTFKHKLITSKLQALFLVSSFSPAQGVVRNIPDLVYQVEGLDTLKLNGQDLGFPATGAVEFNRMTPNRDYATGGICGAGTLFFDYDSGTAVRALGASTLGAAGATSPLSYPFYSQPITLPEMNPTVLPGVAGAEYKQPLALTGGNAITLRIFAKRKDGSVDTTHPVQVLNLTFPDTTVPTPGNSGSYYGSSGEIKPIDKTIEQLKLVGNSQPPDECMINTNIALGGLVPDVSRALVPMGPNVRGDLRLIAARAKIPAADFVPAAGYFGSSPALNPPNSRGWGFTYDKNIWMQLWDRTPEKTDGMMGGADRSNAGAGGLGAGYPGKLVASVDYNLWSGQYNYLVCGTAAFYPDTNAASSGYMKLPNGQPMTNEALLLGSNGTYLPGDWDTGVALWDGPYINKADEGEIGPGAYGSYDGTMSIGSLFSPNRQVPSPVVFGSLSTGVIRGLPWQTLLFCPNPAAKSAHPGFQSPPDHLLLDLFAMPVVEPYAISEPFSTAGKVNLNFQIVPFTTIERSTALQAVLRSTRVSAIPTADGRKYKNGNPQNPAPYRIPIDTEKTIEGFRTKFANPADPVFRSASQICEMFLVPEGSGQTAGSMAAWWDNYKLTGDNLRERPYSHLYSRLTTKSNTYTVHVRVQSLKKLTRNDPAKWVENSDKVVGEYRGAFVIERYLNPNLKDYDPNDALTDYKFRTLSTKQFTP